MDWLKLNSRGILRGTLAAAPHSVQVIWIKLLAMANETRDRDGYLHFKPGQPYSKEYIAQTCGVTIGELLDALDEFKGDIRNNQGRIKELPDGTIYLSNWMLYQESPETVKAKKDAAKNARANNARQSREKDLILEATLRALNENNKQLSTIDRKVRYLPDGNGGILDTITGEKIEASHK